MLLLTFFFINNNQIHLYLGEEVKEHASTNRDSNRYKMGQWIAVIIFCLPMYIPSTSAGIGKFYLLT